MTRHASSIPEQLTPYIRPGECGAKVDVRWLEVSRPVASSGAHVQRVDTSGEPMAAAIATAAATTAGYTGSTDSTQKNAMPTSSSADSKGSQSQPAVLFAVPARVDDASHGGAQSSERQAGARSRSDSEAESGSSLFAFSALPYLVEDLAGAMHPEELVPRSLTAVNLDHRIMGAGGDDSWSACVHDEYLVRPGKFNFSFAIAPYWRAVESGSDKEAVVGMGGGNDRGDKAGECWRVLRKRLSADGSEGEVGSE